LLQDALIAVKNAPSFLVSFFSNQVIKNTDETTRKRLSRSIEIAKKNTSSDVLNDMLNELDIVQMSKKLYISQERRNEVAGNLSGLRKAASKHKNPRDFFRSLNDAEQKQIETKGKQALILADIPSVKGLEFDSVLIPGLERSEFPSSISTPREEKNMFYVAITRAREQLRLFGAASNPSEYLRQ
jgi:DNA helicase-2/ATP-dependent DNA helicase PcrA